MSISDPVELKKRLRAAGFEIYRTKAGQVILAERVRDNLIMDSGVAAEVDADGIQVHVTLRAQASHFPGADEQQLHLHARQLAQAFVDLGYDEQEAVSRSVSDPSNPDQILDTSAELRLLRRVDNEESLFEELRRVLSFQRASSDE